ncbi:hypothetical protein IFM89_021399 [Coptis chinensis]|uniref:Uncharacterized protein n=1 Tax=Coptis chinensis TaxID=261450 RepID=A0A835ID56_9MAGN|nr:hypothetical protein IFM89_021399 [Coptis chinensis]
MDHHHLSLHRVTAQILNTTDALHSTSSSIFLCPRPLINLSSTIHLHQRSFPGFSSKLSNSSAICFATNPGSPSPGSDPPPEKHFVTTSSLGETFSKFQDKTQIFFAVLFWMSLFFWNCAWDGRNDGPNKKSRSGR